MIADKHYAYFSDQPNRSFFFTFAWPLTVMRDFDLDPAQRTRIPREFHPCGEGLLAARVRVTLCVAGRFDLKRPVSGERLRRHLYGLTNSFFQRLPARSIHCRKVQVFGETVVAEVELLERCPAFEDQCPTQIRIRGNPGEQVA